MFKKIKEFFQRFPIYVVRSSGGDSKGMYIMYPGCLEQHGYNVGPRLKFAKRGLSLNRARKDGKKWFIHEGFEIRKLTFFGYMTKLVESHPAQ